MRNYLKMFMSAAIVTALLTGCAKADGGRGDRPKAGSGDKRDQVTIAFWGDQLTEQYGEYLQKSFPDVEFTFYAATNSADFYRFKESQEDLPDILTIRRFALRDVSDWKDSLMDLSGTELANTLHPSYLRSYTYNDGAVNWLPVCAEVDSIIVNKTLLEKNGISVPSNYEEFVSACGRLQELGIRPFASNYAADYTCMEILQGLSASVLSSQKGREWRQQYESGDTDRLSEEVWLPVFEKMEQFIGYTEASPEDLDLAHEAVFTGYMNGETAMVRGTGDEVVRYSDTDRESVLMPYYGETEDQNWYLTYPAFQVAASARAKESPERRKLILEIMSAMLNEEGQRKISSNQNMIPYNTGINIDLSPAMSGLQTCIDNNRLYIRLASADMFSISRQVVQGMILGTYPDARSAFDAFNDALSAGQESEPIVTNIETGYSYTFDPEGGSPAASAVMNSVRDAVGARLLIGPAVSVAGNIAAGEYTETELNYLTMGETTSVLLCEMTGEQVRKYVDYVLTTPGKRGSVINDSSLYVSSGFEMTVKRSDTATGYALEALTIDGRELDPKAVYSTAVIGSIPLMLEDALQSSGVSEYTVWEAPYKQILTDYLAGGNELAEPDHYITLH